MKSLQSVAVSMQRRRSRQRDDETAEGAIIRYAPRHNKLLRAKDRNCLHPKRISAGSF